MRFLISVFAISCLFVSDITSQSFVFGFDGGMTMGLQSWNGFQRDPLFRYHFDGFVESWNEENKYSLFVRGGYHVRGGAIRTRSWYDPDLMQEFDGGTTNMVFNNLVLSLGGKQKFSVGPNSKAYYMLAIRTEYTLSSEFDGYMTSYEGLENKFVFGVSLGGGFEVPFSRWVAATFEVSVHPDFTKQIFIPRQDTGFSDTNGNPIIIQEQNVTNLSIEFTVGLRFLREIIYVD
jgi:hypothetical protein